MSEASKETRARRIIERLKMFNRKERDHLMKFAMCEKPEAPEISTALWEMISNGATMPDPDAMFVGMDYHLNWLYAALAASDDEKLSDKYDNQWSKGIIPGPDNDEPIKRSQEDVDLLVAWASPSGGSYLHLVMIEAKLDTGWSSEQFKSKLERLTLIQEDSFKRGLGFINWRLMLMSPKAPTKKSGFSDLVKKSRYKWAGAKNGSIDWSDKLQTGNLSRVKRVSEHSGEWEVV